MVDYCSYIHYQPEWGIQREPARPLHLRLDYCDGMKFNDNFDWNTAWYDVIQINKNIILLIGPPLYDTKNWIRNNVKFTYKQTELPIEFIELDRVCYTILHVNEWADYIEMNNKEILVFRNQGLFNNKKVLFTMQKNNPIEWIIQWIEYHNKIHGIDGFLIYNNNSSKYNNVDLETALSNLNVTIKIVDWPFKYGPQGSDFSPWDSDYSQYVMMEVAKYRYLSSASLVINNDIDELIFCKGSCTIDNIQEMLSTSDINVLRYKGVWIEPYNIKKQESAIETMPDKRHFKDYYCTDHNNTTGIGYKWILVPNNRTLNQQWLVHNIASQTIESDQIGYAHFLAINTNWSWKRDVYKGNIIDLIPNRYLLANYERIWR